MQKETLFLDNKTYIPLSDRKLKNILKKIPDVPDARAILSYLPDKLVDLLGERPLPLNTQPINLTVKEFREDLEGISAAFYENFSNYIEKGGNCINMSLLMTKYFAERYGFPVVGLFNEEDLHLDYYLRPIIAVRGIASFALEGMIELKIEDRIFVVDYYLPLHEKCLGTDKGMPFVAEVTTPEQRKRLYENYRFHLIESPGFPGEKLPEQLAICYLNPAVSLQFGRQSSLDRWWDLIKIATKPSQKKYSDDTDNNPLCVQFREHHHALSSINMLKKYSAGSKLSEGYSYRNIAPNGRVFYKSNIIELGLLSKLPQGQYEKRNA
jgi:hypothetical protein